jgi:Kinesin motor domain
LQEIPTGQGNRVRAEVAGLFEQECTSVDELMTFFTMCFENRSTGSTNLNATSSRSHALFTINVHRVVVSVGDGVDEYLKVRAPPPTPLRRAPCSHPPLQTHVFTPDFNLRRFVQAAVKA